MPSDRRAPHALLIGLALGVITGALATVAAILSSPELYIDWGALAGTLVVIPLFTVGAAAVVALPLAATRRIAWSSVAVAVAVSLLVGEALFAASQGSSFARWSAARHWAAVERRAAGEREETERETCRRVLAESRIPPPPPPAPPGAAAARPEPGARSATSLMAASRERCAELLGR